MELTAVIAELVFTSMDATVTIVNEAVDVWTLPASTETWTVAESASTWTLEA